MKQPSQRPRQPKKAASPTTNLVGLKPSAYMPVVFQGKTYDLANLTKDELAYLLKFPKQVPYLKTT